MKVFRKFKEFYDKRRMRYCLTLLAVLLICTLGIMECLTPDRSTWIEVPFRATDQVKVTFWLQNGSGCVSIKKNGLLVEEWGLYAPAKETMDHSGSWHTLNEDTDLLMKLSDTGVWSTIIFLKPTAPGEGLV